MKALQIVVVEDAAIILCGLKMQLEKMGHTVAGIALNGEDAVRIIRKEHPDFVLADINIPKKDGLTVVREACLENMIPTVILTGHYADNLLKQADIPCVYGYLMKPVSFEQLGATIEIAWNRHKNLLETEDRAIKSEIRLEERKQIERAKGIIMDTLGLKEEEAMKYIQKMAKDQRKKLVVVSREIIRAREKNNI